MKTAIDKNESEFDRMKRKAQEWLDKDRNHSAPPFLHLALREFKEAKQEPPKDKDELKDELLKFKKWYDSLYPASKCTVHPPAGSGGSYGIYNLTDVDLVNNYLRKTQ